MIWKRWPPKILFGLIWLISIPPPFSVCLMKGNKIQDKMDDWTWDSSLVWTETIWRKPERDGTKALHSCEGKKKIQNNYQLSGKRQAGLCWRPWWDPAYLLWMEMISVCNQSSRSHHGWPFCVPKFAKALDAIYLERYNFFFSKRKKESRSKQEKWALR